MKEKSLTFCFYTISLKEIADNIEYRANLWTIYIKKEYADTLLNAFFNHN